MKILTLFIALFLTFLPESAPFEGISQAQDVCCEDAVDIEEEAVIKTVIYEQCLAYESFKSGSPVSPRPHSDSVEHHHAGFYIERQWLTHCRLRL